jgi:hypothetical protein
LRKSPGIPANQLVDRDRADIAFRLVHGNPLPIVSDIKNRKVPARRKAVRPLISLENADELGGGLGGNPNDDWAHCGFERAAVTPTARIPGPAGRETANNTAPTTTVRRI